MAYPASYQGGRVFLRELSFPFLWLSFLLFPVAHLSIVSGIPAYWSETTLALSLLLIFFADPIAAISKTRHIFREEWQFLIFAAMFVLGIVLAYVLNPHSISGLGEIKSFYLAPVAFLAAILIHSETKERVESLATGWFLGLAAAAFASIAAYVLGWLTYDGRLAGPYLSPNHLAMLMAPGVPLGAYFIGMYSGGRRPMAIVATVLIIFSLWATRSYAAWGAVLAVIGVGSILYQVKKPRFPLIAPVAILVLVFGTVLWHEQGTEKWQSLISGDERSSLASRFMIWRVAEKIAVDAFPFGIGTGRFQEVYLSEQVNFPPYLEWAVPTPHNLYLYFFLEGGIMTLVGFLGCVSIVIIRARRVFAHQATRLGVLGIMLIMLYLIYGLVDTPYMKNDLALAVWGSLGLSLAALRLRG
ncbi:MAG: O-antigen ligase family protein [Candidatus Moraniibacteriota bacterium]|nr:MAG: O-antigen ligase family protein [Candidatus Moranbacteria bacterium]